MSSKEDFKSTNLPGNTENPQETLIRRLVADLSAISGTLPGDVVLDSIKNLGKRLIEAADIIKLIRDQPQAFAAYAPTKRKRRRRRRRANKVSSVRTGLAYHTM